MIIKTLSTQSLEIQEDAVKHDCFNVLSCLI